MTQRELKQKYYDELLRDAKKNAAFKENRTEGLPLWILIVAIVWWGVVMLTLSHLQLNQKVEQGQTLAVMMQIFLEAGIMLVIYNVKYKSEGSKKAIVCGILFALIGGLAMIDLFARVLGHEAYVTGLEFIAKCCGYALMPLTFGTISAVNLIRYIQGNKRCTKKVNVRCVKVTKSIKREHNENGPDHYAEIYYPVWEGSVDGINYKFDNMSNYKIDGRGHYSIKDISGDTDVLKVNPNDYSEYMDKLTRHDVKSKIITMSGASIVVTALEIFLILNT